MDTKAPERKSVVSVQLPQSDLDSLRRLARESDRSVSSVIRKEIAAHVRDPKEQST
jgi:ribbon-helix-helix CopG family protein